MWPSNRSGNHLDVAILQRLREGACLAREHPPNVEPGLECESSDSRLMRYLLYLWFKKGPLNKCVLCDPLNSSTDGSSGEGLCEAQALSTSSF